MEKQVDKILQNSELIRMAQKHFDSESAEEMIQELKTELLKMMKNL